MANVREIRSRINGVKSTRQITKAMKMVSVSKLRKTQASMNAMRLFSDGCRQVMFDLLGSGTPFAHPLLSPRKQVSHVTYVLVVGNRGLCGAYNSNLVRYLEKMLEHETHSTDVVVIGRWTSDALNRMPVSHTVADFGDAPTPEACNEVLEYLKQKYLSGQTDRICVVYQHFVNALRQDPTSVQLLPAVLPEPDQKPGAADYLFEPDQEQIVNQVVELYLSSTMYQLLLEAKSGEHSARTTAMGAASDNTDELIEKLSLELNRARQGQITTEISEIAGGALALEQKKM